MLDFLLDLSFDARAMDLDETVQAILFLTASTGSSSVEVNGTTTITAYFDSEAERDEAHALFSSTEGVELHRHERERLDWLERYQQSLEPLFIGQRFVVVPDPTLLPSDGERLTIVVPQEQAFGTGSHETTALCIEVLETLPVTGRRALDIGAGSGILALAACRLGAAKAIAFDNDVDAYGALRDNRVRNKVPDERMPLFIGSLEALRAGQFDLLTMNIIPEVILPLLGDVVPRMTPDARLVLSGILIVKRDDVIRGAATHGLHLIEERERGEWWAGVFAS